MTPKEILDLSDLNTAESLRQFARFHPDSRIVEQDDLLMVAAADDFPIGFSNAVFPLCEGPDPERVLAASDAFFGPLGRGYTVWIRDHLDAKLELACQAGGYQALGDSPGMVLEAPVFDAKPSAEIEFAALDDLAAVRDFIEVSVAAYGTIGMPEASVRKTFERPERFLQPHVLGVVAREGERPLSTAMAIVSHGIAGLYWVGTVEMGRKRGLGDACTRIVSNAAFALGARAVVLQASKQGEPIYLRMGYREVTRYRWWVRFAKV